MFQCSWCKNYDVLNFPNNEPCEKCNNGSFLKIKICGIKVLYHTRKETLELNFEHNNTEQAIFHAFEQFDLYEKHNIIHVALEFDKKFKKLIEIF